MSYPYNNYVYRTSFDAPVQSRVSVPKDMLDSMYKLLVKINAPAEVLATITDAGVEHKTAGIINTWDNYLQSIRSQVVLPVQSMSKRTVEGKVNVEAMRKAAEDLAARRAKAALRARERRAREKSEKLLAKSASKSSLHKSDTLTKDTTFTDASE